VGLIERDNRKSHLAPQLSPSTQQLLRSGDSPTGPYATNSPDYSLPTPTSGDIPIGGGDVRSAVTSPQYNEPITNSRSPTKNGSSSLGRAGGAPFHPGLPPRVSTTNSVPKVTTLNAPDQNNGPSSAGATTFTTTTLPMRPAPPAGPLPPPPVPRKEDSDSKKESRRQATFGNGLYSSGYSTSGTGQ
jgi:mitogen-activated protein kinase kinase